MSKTRIGVVKTLSDAARAIQDLLRGLNDAETALAGTSGAGVPTTRQVVSGAGLTGGGDLSVDRTLSVGAGTGVQVNADSVEVKYGTTAGTAAQGNDSRLSDSRTPTAHKTTHQDGGTDELNVGGLSGVLADPQTPTAHATSHKSGGADAIKLDELAAPTDVTTLNASTTAHGLMPKLTGSTSTFFRSDGTQAVPTAVVGDPSFLVSTNDSIAAGKFRYYADYIEVADGIELEVADAALVEVG